MAGGEKRDPQAVERRAARASKQGQLESALELYLKLEKSEPANPEWPRQLASIYGRQNELEKELDALIRCAGHHAKRGEFLPALAAYKMILSIDPGHVLAQQLLSELQPHQTISVTYQEDRAPSAALQAPQAEIERDRKSKRRKKPSARRSGGGRRPARHDAARAATQDSAPLDELVLTDMVAGARSSDMADEGIHEIPLGDVVAADTEAREATPTGAPLDADQELQLERSPLFDSLDPDSLRELLREVRLVELAAGEELFHQGDSGDTLYIVATGAVVPIAEGQPRTRLAVLEPGEFFGEIALFTDQPRNATIEALVETQLLSIGRPVMWNLLRQHPDVLSILLRFLRERLIGRLVRTSPLFRIFSGAKRSVIVRRFQFLEVEDGHRIIEQHHPAEAVFILLSGRADVVHQADSDDEEDEEQKVLATLAPGELCGEMTLLWREPSLASVIARGKCWFLALPAQSFREMLEHHPQLAAMAAGIAEERRAANKRTLRDALGHHDGKVGMI